MRVWVTDDSLGPCYLGMGYRVMIKPVAVRNASDLVGKNIIGIISYDAEDTQDLQESVYRRIQSRLGPLQ